MAVPSLKEQQQADLALLYDFAMPWVEEAQAEPAEGSFPVRMDYDPQETGEDMSYQRHHATLCARGRDLPDAGYQMTITVSGTVWTVSRARYDGARGEWTLSVYRDKRPAL